MRFVAFQQGEAATRFNGLADEPSGQTPLSVYSLGLIDLSGTMSKPGELAPISNPPVQVTVVTRYAPERSNPGRHLWFFLYTITIKNVGDKPVQLMSRHWVITDAQGSVEEVRGPGVVGKQPRLESQQSFEYTSGCPLGTPFGSMRGSYQFVTEDGTEFEVAIPGFALRDPRNMQ